MPSRRPLAGLSDLALATELDLGGDRPAVQLEQDRTPDLSTRCQEAGNTFSHWIDWGG